MRAFRSYMAQGIVVPIVKGRRGGSPDLFDYPTLNEFLGKPKQHAGRPKRGLDANEPLHVESAIAKMVDEITTEWPYRSRQFLIGESIDAGVLATRDLRGLPASHRDYVHAIITMLVLAARDPKHATAWPTLLILIRRLEVAGASIETTANHLELDPSTVRLYRDKWRTLRESAEYRPRSGDIVPGRLVPLTASEVEAITKKPRPSWGWRTERKMSDKDPEAVARTGRRHRTLTGIEWREIAANEIAEFVDGGKHDPEHALSPKSKRSRIARAEGFGDRHDEGGPMLVPSWWNRPVHPTSALRSETRRESRRIREEVRELRHERPPA